MNRGNLFAALALSLWIAGCGDEDAPSDAGTDSGTVDGGNMNDGGADNGSADSGADDGSVPDGSQVDAEVEGCSLIDQTGCAAEQDCSWVEGELGGSIECVPTGTIPLHGDCLSLQDGTPDQCASGLTCSGGKCERVCSMAEGCSGAAVCQLWVGFVGDGDTGICSPTCDPVSQTRSDDGAAACGSSDPQFPTWGCYGTFGGPFTCSRFPNSVMNRTHGATALTSPSGAPYVIGCAPGYVSLPTSVQTTFHCHALCTPAETRAGSDAQRQGVAPHTCSARGASAATEECRFSGFYLQDPSEGLPAVGVCVDPTEFTWDHHMDGDLVTPEVPWPSCSTLTSGDLDGNGVPDHQSWGCAPTPAP